MFIDTTTWSQLFPDQVTIQSLTQTAPNAYGVPSQSWTAVSGMSNLPCILTEYIPRNSGEVQGQTGEPGMAPGSTATVTHEIILQSYVAGITEKMRAVIDTQVYNILISDRDPHKSVTVLKVRKVVG